MNARLMRSLGIETGGLVLVKQRAGESEGEAGLMAALDDKLPDDCVRVAAGHASTADLGAMFGALTVEKITAAAGGTRAA